MVSGKKFNNRHRAFPYDHQLSTFKILCIYSQRLSTVILRKDVDFLYGYVIIYILLYNIGEYNE